jgi:formate hydrogenlyase subunit 3/multisubunit Na+/H+ antiporter MnhD subunit
MQVPGLLFQSILVPIITAFAFALLGRRMGRRTGWVACGVLVYTTFLLFLAGAILSSGASKIEEEYVWNTYFYRWKFGYLLADGLSLPVSIVMNLVCATCAIYSVRYIENRIHKLYGDKNRGMYGVYYSIFMLFPAGLVGVSLSANLIELFIFIELILIPAFVMIDLFGYGERGRIATMYFIWNHLGAALFLIGVVLAFANVGSFEVSALTKLSTSSMAFWVCLFFLVGWLIKMSAFGFHTWIRYAHGHTPTSIAPIIAAVVGLGNYVIVRLLVQQLPSVFRGFTFVLILWALITMIYGAFLTIAQDDIKLLYACSTMSQTAYSLFGIASMTLFGVSGAIFYFLSHTIGKCILFLVAGIVLTQTGLRDMKEMGGLAGRMPLTATLCILGSMILSALPPLSGFQAEWIMFAGIFRYGIKNSLTLVVTLAGCFATFLSLVYTFWPAVRIFFGQLPQSLEKVKRPPLSMIAPLFILAFISFLLGIFPNLITNFLTSALLDSFSR